MVSPIRFQTLEYYPCRPYSFNTQGRGMTLILYPSAMDKFFGGYRAF